MRDEGRPFEIEFQDWVSNHFKRRISKVWVVSIEEKMSNDLSGMSEKDE